MLQRSSQSKARWLGVTALGLSLAGLAIAEPIANDAGFVLSLDGDVIDADPVILPKVERIEREILNADIRLTYDSAEPEPRLNLEMTGPARSHSPGDSVTFVSEMNYPTYITSGEIRIIDRAGLTGARVVATYPLDANGKATVVLPSGSDLVAVHRVYNKRGRFDETHALPLSRPDDRGLYATIEEGVDFAAVRNIPVKGGTVTVSAANVAPGGSLVTMGENVRPDSNGKLVIQRILPSGEYEIDAKIVGPAQNASVVKIVDVEGTEWFYVVVADLTYATKRDGGTGERYDETTARLQYYVDGETDGGWRVTSSLDTGEEKVGNILSRLDGKDPRDVIDRLDQNAGYLTFGDDSTIRDNTPTSGRFYLRVERDGTYALWGDYQAEIGGSGYLRNDRTLYGALGHYQSQEVTSRGEARVRVDAYAAQPDQLSARESFRGTGGSLYFLSRQDVTPGTEKLVVELRDATTGRVIERQVLKEGEDYEFNAFQGVITLNSPLTGSLNDGLIQSTASGDTEVRLVAQYDFTPTTADVDGFSIGARSEAWVTDSVRVGATAMRDTSGLEDMTAASVDLRYQHSDDTFVQIDAAQSEGSPIETLSSEDGGLISNTDDRASGSGEAYKVEGQASFTDLGISKRDGVVGGYYEHRTEGFATLDTQVTDNTGSETLYGAFVAVEAEGRQWGYRIYADVYENAQGKSDQKIGAEVSAGLSETLELSFGAEHVAEKTSTTSGNRTDVAAKLTYAPSDDFSVYGYAQVTADSDGLDDNSRYGIGFTRGFANGWTVEGEVSDGDEGTGGRLAFRREDDANNSIYFGYELDPGRSIAHAGSNRGKFIAGASRNVTDDLRYNAEATYDLWGYRRELTSAYGVDYSATQYLTYGARFEYGRIEDDADGNFERRALSFSLRHDSEDFTARAQLEYRQDRATEVSTRSDSDAIALTMDGEYHIDESRRLSFALYAADFDSEDETSLLNGRLVDARLGYAVRPVEHERYNLLFGYRYLHDTVGQKVDGDEGTGPVQRSHILSLEGNYDIDEQLTIGGKIGGRWSDSADDATSAWVSNDAWLAIINARYHILHNWDALLEARHYEAVDAQLSETGMLAAVYRHFGDNVKVGVGYNFTNFSDDLGDLTYDDEGAFLNIIAKF